MALLSNWYCTVVREAQFGPGQSAHRISLYHIRCIVVEHTIPLDVATECMSTHSLLSNIFGISQANRRRISNAW
jgi:hypothetical protein